MFYYCVVNCVICVVVIVRCVVLSCKVGVGWRRCCWCRCVRCARVCDTRCVAADDVTVACRCGVVHVAGFDGGGCCYLYSCCCCVMMSLLLLL